MISLLPLQGSTDSNIQRDEAWKVWPYPCIGQFRFLDLSISLSPHYPAILKRLKTGEQNFLDLGCCFGQDLRKLAADGAPSEHLYGSDLRPEFFDLGYKLFKDTATLKSKFLVGDVLDTSSPLSELDGKIDIIYAASFLHLFGYEDQVKVCKRIVKLLKEKKDSVVLGRQIGNSNAGEQLLRNDRIKTRWRHNEESFKKIWEEVGQLTGSKWVSLYPYVFAILLFGSSEPGASQELLCPVIFVSGAWLLSS
jgi:SAM-dependent methyltransferase